MKSSAPPDTDKARNVAVDVDGTYSLDEMEKILLQTTSDLSLVQSHVTTLSQKKYPGNRHWHFKEDLKENGCLDVTYWPAGPALWITIRNYEPNWVHQAGESLAKKLTPRVRTSSR